MRLSNTSRKNTVKLFHKDKFLAILHKDDVLI